jgi:hypothetical protein
VEVEGVEFDSLREWKAINARDLAAQFPQAGAQVPACAA